MRLDSYTNCENLPLRSRLSASTFPPGVTVWQISQSWFHRARIVALGGAVARSRNSGVLGAWAEAQRRQQRLYESQQRAWRAEQLQQERAQRAATRAHARDQREALHAYQHGRELDVAARTGELDAQVTMLGGILQSVLAAP